MSHFRFSTAVILFLRSFTAVMIPVGVALSTYFCKKIHVSPAVVQSFSTMSAFTTALLFFKLYNERLNRQHIVGMLMIVASVLIVAVCKSVQMSNQEEEVYLTALDLDDATKQDIKKEPE
jgi:drug/metabolite transporter (DMT)-like permease